MEYIFIGLTSVIILIAISFFRKFFFSKNAVPPKKASPSAISGFANCPICSSPLLEGQNLVSKIITSAASETDKLCYVYGCSSCYPNCKPLINRTCPVCHKQVAQTDFLFSRMFLKTKSGKPHVIINGCKNCNRK